jgi:cytochrome P450
MLRITAQWETDRSERSMFGRFGKVFKTYVLGRITVFMTGREAAKILLSGKDGVVSLNLFYTGKQVLGPTSLLTTNGEEHKKLRRLIGEPLSIDALKKHFDFINELAVQTLDTWLGRRVLVLEEASSVSTHSRRLSVRERFLFRF